MHGGTTPSGPEHPTYEHGAYSKHFKRSLTEEETEAFDALVAAFEENGDAQAVIRHLAAEALLKYVRSEDTRFLREARQLLAEFNIADATEHVEVDSRHAEVAYEIVRAGDGVELPSGEDGEVDHEALGFTSAPATIDVETPGGDGE